MLSRTPKSFFLTCGSAEGFTPLNAFDAALIAAGIGDLNLVKVTSIIPPGCREGAAVTFPKGSIVPAAFAYITSDIPGEVISAAVAVALPRDPEEAGLIMEYSARGHQEEAEQIVRRMAEEGMRIRGKEIGALRSCSVEYKVEKIGAAVAAVVFRID